MANDTVTKNQNLPNRKFTSGLPSHVCLNRIDKAGHHVLLIQRKRNGRCSNFTRLPTTETRARYYIAKVTNWKKWSILSNCIYNNIKLKFTERNVFDLPQSQFRASTGCSAPGGRLCKTRYNTTAPLYGVSLTSGQPVTIVQKFPDLLQQVIFEVCEWVQHLFLCLLKAMRVELLFINVWSFLVCTQFGRVWRRARWVRSNLRPLFVPGYPARSGDANRTRLRPGGKRLRLSSKVRSPCWPAGILTVWSPPRFELIM